jgi:hypothetical protein
MLAANFSWQDLKSKVTYLYSDSLARVRKGLNALGWYPVFLNEATGQAYIERYGECKLVEGLAGFEDFEKVKTKSKPLYDTSTGEMLSQLS